ncbi:MAG: DUF5050 domain-containing protein, partial [Eubacterium sp.]|nr:DUF5050 domain-containing protein [Eubacterium sp.]
SKPIKSSAASDFYKRQKLDGSKNEIIIDEAVDNLWVDGDWIFYTKYLVSDLYRVKIDGSQKELMCQYSMC